MKIFAFTLLMFCSNLLLAQKIKLLDEADGGDKLEPNTAIIYGNFIPLNQKWIDRDAQYVILENLDTKEYFSFKASRSMSSKPVVFCLHVKPGNYEIARFKWANAKWYGETLYTYP